jgi:hypothetical protein
MNTSKNIDNWQKINQFAYDGGTIPIREWSRNIPIKKQDFRSISGEDFFAVAGVRRKIQCKASGLTGQELKMCKAKMLVSCGRKPAFFASKAKKNKWFNCTQKLFVEYEAQVKESQKEPADTSVPQPDAETGSGSPEKETGIDMTKVALYGGILLVVGGIFALAAARKRAKAGRMQTIPIGR